MRDTVTTPIPCLHGPLDGECALRLVREFLWGVVGETVLIHRYVLETDDDGSRFYRYDGIVK